MTSARRTTVTVVLAALAMVLAACSSTNGGSSATTSPAGSTPATGMASGTLTVSAAASLTEPFKKIGEAFRRANPGVTDVRFSFDSSSTLAKQIQDGAPADVFASADEANMKKLTDASLVAGTPQVFARNRLAIVVKKGNPKGMKTLADLATVGTVSLCGSEVPCGKYADQVLQQAGVTIPTDKVTRGQNVKATLAAVTEGDAVAAIVYVTDAVAAGDSVTAVDIPEAQNVIATYPIGVLSASEHADLADAFAAYVASDDGQMVLKEHGFLAPT